MTTENTTGIMEEMTETVETVGVETFPPQNDQVDNMLYTLPMMGKGMLAIFLVTLIIVASVAILNKTTGGRNKIKE